MQILCDTNLLIRSIKLDDPHCSAAQDSIKSLLKQGHEPVLVPQCLYEYYVVATRPIAANGLGRTSGDAMLDIERLQIAFTVLRDERLVFDRWCDLIKKHPTLVSKHTTLDWSRP